jgi:ketosteroid isomerase-like protein
MSETSYSVQDSSTASIQAAEAQRCAAIKNRDRTALSEILSDALSYVHSTGVHENKEGYIATSIDGAPRTVERGTIDVLVYGDIALVRGDYSVHITPGSGFVDGHRVDASGLQVWRRENAQWRLFLHQGTAKPK